MKEPPNSRYFAPARSGQPSVWITRRRSLATRQTSLTPSAQTCGVVPPSPNRSIPVPDGRVERHLGKPLASSEEPLQRAWVDDGAGEQVGPGLLALLDHSDRHLAQPLGDGGRVLQQLPESDRAGQPCGAGAHDRDADLDPLVFGIRGRGNRLRDAERRRKFRRTSHAARRCRMSSVSFGTIWCRSPTTPRSAYSKIGAFGSLLIATITFAPCMPTLCWIAPEIPTAM